MMSAVGTPFPTSRSKRSAQCQRRKKVKSGDDKSITVHADGDLFGRLLIVAPNQSAGGFEL